MRLIDSDPAGLDSIAKVLAVVRTREKPARQMHFRVRSCFQKADPGIRRAGGPSCQGAKEKEQALVGHAETSNRNTSSGGGDGGARQGTRTCSTRDGPSIELKDSQSCTAHRNSGKPVARTWVSMKSFWLRLFVRGSRNKVGDRCELCCEQAPLLLSLGLSWSFQHTASEML